LALSQILISSDIWIHFRIWIGIRDIGVGIDGGYAQVYVSV